MKPSWFVLVVALIAFPGPCQARPNQEGLYDVLRVGTLSCETWIQQRADKSNEKHFINSAWIQGYLTATNVFGEGSSHLAKGTDAEGIMAWVDRYCEKRPADAMAVAAKALVDELTQQARGRNEN